ncbi:MAG: TraB family protein, partial [Nanoarchaeota archaeon]|nr:TraB family protein [Nanoarchaeota archaeon]
MIEKIDNIILLGTSHVAKQSAKEIEEAIEIYKPEVVGIELDIDRLKTLLSSDSNANKKRRSNRKMIKEIGFSGYLFAMIAGFVQDKVGKSLGIEAGIDMKTAYQKSREKKIPVALIDLNI